MSTKPTKKILYIEDDPEARYLMADIFRYKGYSYIEAARGLEGIQLAKEHLPHLILIDLQLPDMQGYEVTTLLKSLPELENTPIIALTAETQKDVRSLVITAGCDGYISKPINITEFLFKIEEYLAGKKDHISPDSEKLFLQKYNIQLVSKLKKKIIELEELNSNLTKVNKDLSESRDYLAKYNDRLFYLNTVANYLRTQIDPNKMVRVLPQKVVKGFQVDRCVLFDLNQESNVLLHFASAGIASSDLMDISFSLSSVLLKQIKDEGGIIWIKSQEEILDQSLLNLAEDLQSSSFIIGNLRELHTHSEVDTEIGVAIEKTQLDLNVQFAKDIIFFIDKGTSNELFATYEIRILKSFLQTVSVIYENMVLYTRLHKLYEIKVQEAMRDGLTKLYNYRYFIQELERETNRARRFNTSFSVLMIDIDFFKKYNDTYGHLEGDKILRTMADLFVHNTRSTDTVARYGGEEFVVVLPGLKKKDAKMIAEKLRKLIEDHDFFNEEVQSHDKLTISIGVANFPDDSKQPSQLLKLADKALYQAKNEGRNRVSEANEV